jgi:hypothetical protein
MEGVIVLHETIQAMHRKKQDGLFLKIDFEKAYNKIIWSFVEQILRMKGFSPKWCQWVASFMESEHVGIKSMIKVEEFFKPKKEFDRMIPYL